MKSASAVLALLVAAAQAVDMKIYKETPDVDAGYRDFVEEYYATSEDATATTTYTDFWPSDDSGIMILAGSRFEGAKNISAVKQRLLPPNSGKSWWHILVGSSVKPGSETDKSKTFTTEMVVQTTYVGGNCSEALGHAEFTILKGEDGSLNLEPHKGGLGMYNLTVSDTRSPTDVPCRVV
ncbi:hypothetical protein HYFRA_00009059 [Hymenoscyphus fraxineus]|uniref:Uncharacterized protein n=1 Tax=Hymenoscyphus fraxineus TaxID=746836 RepID=A0A9N9PS98_9HELO|nr:hypothetical protein HYFRA_00009059 [Hymenoscyphus fraxineus]